MNTANAAPGRQFKRRARASTFALPHVFSTVPPRVFGHAVVVVLCLVVAYAGRTNHLSDQLVLWQTQPDGARPSPASLGSDLLASDSLVRPPIADTRAPSSAGLQVTHYETQPGDTVAALAARFDISENTIIWTNNLPLDGHLDPGHELTILPISGVLYTVKTGETLTDIAQRFQSDSGAIAQVNQLPDASQPAVGAQLVIPGGRPVENPRPDLSAPSISRPNVARTDSSTTSDPVPLPSVQVSPRSGFDVSSAVDLFRRLPFVGAPETAPAPAVPSPQQAPPPPNPTTPLAPIVYTVSDGDTLSTIAQKFGVSSDAIAAASGLTGAVDSIGINQKLLIPPVPGVLHTVQEGDTVGQIAERYGASEPDIVRANVLVEPYLLKIGQVLVVPGGSIAPQPTPVAPVVVPETNYQVQDGDSLSTIAQSFGVGLPDIITLNGLQDPFLIHPGQQLMIHGAARVPADPAQARPTPADHPAAAAASAPAPVEVAVASAPAPVEIAVAPVPTPRPKPVVAAPVRAPSSSGWGLVDVASRYLGTPYVWGGTSPGGFDCSGFVWYVYRKAGLGVPRDMWGQLQSGTRVSRSNLQPGDIVFFAGTYGSGLSHDGVYIGGGRFIHAADYGVGVIVSSFSNAYYANHYYGATRPG